ATTTVARARVVRRPATSACAARSRFNVSPACFPGGVAVARGLVYAADGPLDARSELLLFPMALDGQFDEAVEQARVRQAARLPQLRVHADRREAGNRVDLVHVQR